MTRLTDRLTRLVFNSSMLNSIPYSNFKTKYTLFMPYNRFFNGVSSEIFLTGISHGRWQWYSWQTQVTISSICKVHSVLPNSAISLELSESGSVSPGSRWGFGPSLFPYLRNCWYLLYSLTLLRVKDSCLKWVLWQKFTLLILLFNKIHLDDHRQVFLLQVLMSRLVLRKANDRYTSRRNHLQSTKVRLGLRTKRQTNLAETDNPSVFVKTGLRQLVFEWL